MIAWLRTRRLQKQARKNLRNYIDWLEQSRTQQVIDLCENVIVLPEPTPSSEWDQALDRWWKSGSHQIGK